jgi:hypothetical protein
MYTYKIFISNILYKNTASPLCYESFEDDVKARLAAMKVISERNLTDWSIQLLPA